MQQTELSGILLMDKPQGFTSHDVVAKLRGILHTRKIGHGGTLDPLATGVLPVFIGGATKAADFAAAQDKEYVAGFTLGYCTDTQDVTGEIVQTGDRIAAEYAVKRAVRGFVGPQQQIPPMYSAVKVNGQKLYDLARKGREVERPARDIIVHEMELLDFDEMPHAIWAVCAMTIWMHIGVSFIFLLVGFRNVPEDLLESALLDGAGPFRRIKDIIIPMASPQIFFVLFLNIGSSFKSFNCLAIRLLQQLLLRVSS